MLIVSDTLTRTLGAEFEGIQWPFEHDIEYSILANPLPLRCSRNVPSVATFLTVKLSEDRCVQGDDLAFHAATPVHLAGNLTSIPSGSLPRSQLRSHPLLPHQNTPSTMTKKHRSLHSVVIPSFLQSSTPSFMTHRKSASRSRSCSYVDQALSSSALEQPPPHATSYPEPQPSTMTPDDPPPFLLDDDPFANLTTSAVVSPRSSIDKGPMPPVVTRTSSTVLPPAIPIDPSSPTPTVPRSPLSPPHSVQSSYFGTVMPQTAAPLSPRFRSLRIKPAYERPAFASRPSLPSLHTLTQTSLSPPRKVRKGRVGARLPFEPWESLDSDECGTSAANTPCATRPSSPLGGSARMLIHPSPADRDPIGSDLLYDLSLLAPDHEPFSFPFHDNISTPSLELSSASLSRSLSLESMSLPEMSPCDDELNFASEGPSDHDIDYSPRELTNLLLPSLYRIDPTVDRGDKLAYDIPLPTISEFPLEFQAGTSADTVRPSVLEVILEQEHPSLDMQTDSTGWSSSRAYSSSSQLAPDSGNLGGYGYTNRGGHNGYPPTGGGGSWGGGNGDDGDGGGGRRPTRRTVLSGTSTPGTSSDEEDSEEDYGEPIPGSNMSRGTDAGMEGVIDSEDDVPLARRIPTALKAQRTIRQKFREERDKRRRERALEAEKQNAGHSPPTASNDGSSLVSGLYSSQEAPLQASKQVQGRSRARTLTSNIPGPFSPEDLARKLQDVQVAEVSQGPRRRPSTAPRNTEVTRGRMVDESYRPVFPQSVQQRSQFTSTSPSRDASLRILHSMRSFHHTEARRNEETPMSTLSADMTTITTSRVSRATSRTRGRVREETSPPSAWQCPPLPPRLSLENSPPVPSLPLQPRLSAEAPRKLSKGAHPSPITLATGTSIEIERSPKPLLPPQAMVLAAANIKTQQRIFIGDIQRFNVVEIDNDTDADDVVTIVRNQGSLSGFTGQGDWMLFEVAQDFGMERPIRGYELLSDIQASWNKDKLVNMFVLKMTPLAAPLSREAIPSSSPTCGGYVEWESKKGKWSKRWLRLREHSLWLSKRDNGKDEIFLCSLSNFDAYFVKRVTHKAPKPFCFAIKSTDNLSFFENTADYLHTFSCQPQDGQKWIERILVARSYVLHQERHVLFNSKATGGNTATATLQRAGTRKVRPTQPLVNLPTNEVFEPGSLLSSKS